MNATKILWGQILLVSLVFVAFVWTATQWTANGINNSILDNCHVLVSFATNDERTARRVSDALGTATEIRDAKNYASHCLSPWLGHVMVSRQATVRPLLTPGEVM